MQITHGKIEGAQKIVIYGPEGIGKSYFASRFPNPLFIDTEGSTKHMDVARLPNPSSWTMLLEEVRYVKTNPSVCNTLIIDTADWAEHLCMIEICAKAQKKGIEDFGYGKGYTYLAEEFGQLLNLLTDVIETGNHVVLVAHAQMRKFEQPDEMGAYDRWEMKLQKKVYPLVKEWADMVLFANYKTYVVDADGQGTSKGTNKAQGGKRVMYTTHHPCWDAKNRHDLLDVLDFHYDEIKHCIPARGAAAPAPVQTPPPVQTIQQQTPPPVQPPEQKPDPVPTWDEVGTTYKNEQELEAARARAEAELNGLPKALADLMQQNKVTVAEIQKAVASKGYYPEDTPISNYDPGFVSGVLVGAWAQVFKIIQDIRDDIPF